MNAKPFSSHWNIKRNTKGMNRKKKLHQFSLEKPSELLTPYGLLQWGASIAFPTGHTGTTLVKRWLARSVKWGLGCLHPDSLSSNVFMLLRLTVCLWKLTEALMVWKKGNCYRKLSDAALKNDNPWQPREKKSNPRHNFHLLCGSKENYCLSPCHVFWRK